MLVLLLLQATAAPDIEFHVRATARDVRIEQQGETRLEVRAVPDAGSGVETRRIPQARGQRRLRDVAVEVRARAHIADPQQGRQQQETSSVQPR